MAAALRYALQSRDASESVFRHQRGFSRPGDALVARDLWLHTEPQWLPSGRARAVDMEAGAILEWADASVSRA